MSFEQPLLPSTRSSLPLYLIKNSNRNNLSHLDQKIHKSLLQSSEVSETSEQQQFEGHNQRPQDKYPLYNVQRISRDGMVAISQLKKNNQPGQPNQQGKKQTLILKWRKNYQSELTNNAIEFRQHVQQMKFVNRQFNDRLLCLGHKSRWRLYALNLVMSAIFRVSLFLSIFLVMIFNKFYHFFIVMTCLYILSAILYYITIIKLVYFKSSDVSIYLQKFFYAKDYSDIYMDHLLNKNFSKSNMIRNFLVFFKPSHKFNTNMKITLFKQDLYHRIEIVVCLFPFIILFVLQKDKFDFLWGYDSTLGIAYFSYCTALLDYICFCMNRESLFFIGTGCAIATIILAIHDLWKNQQQKKKTTSIKICLTGGPCGGKSEGIQCIYQQFKQISAPIFIVPEAATIIGTAGLNLDLSSFQPRQIELFQIFLMKLQYNLETGVIQIAALLEKLQKTPVILCDRGLMDGKAYAGPKNWKKMLTDLEITEQKLLNRYDAVVHMVTAAKGANNHYVFTREDEVQNDRSNEGQRVRREPPQFAIDLDAKIQQCYKNHKCRYIISNEFYVRNFEDKKTILLAQFCQILSQIIQAHNLSDYYQDYKDYIRKGSDKEDTPLSPYLIRKRKYQHFMDLNKHRNISQGLKK